MHFSGKASKVDVIAIIIKYPKGKNDHEIPSHLDFHTSEAIPGIAKNFSKQQFQDTFRRGHVDSITVFSKCHHGWAYHPSEANETHPHLDFDLLGAQIEAAHEIGVKTPVYLSAGLDESWPQAPRVAEPRPR